MHWHTPVDTAVSPCWFGAYFWQLFCRRSWQTNCWEAKKVSRGGVLSISDGVLYDCPARIAHRHKHHPAHTRNDAPPLLCTHYQHEPGKWTCEVCLRVRPETDFDHTLEDGCRFVDGGFEVARRRRNDFGEPAHAGFCKDFVIPVGGAADRVFVSDNIKSDIDVPIVYDKL